MYKKKVLSTLIAASILPLCSDLSAQTDNSEAVMVEEVVVTGIKASLSKGLDIKRDNAQLVDAIVAEDIGKFPDNNVVEALQRIPGVQVTDRGAGETNVVAVRGLTDVATTVNGRKIFTAAGRNVALADIPASLLSGVEVYKTRSASMITSGMAGQIDIHTQRPFNFDGFKVVASAKGTYMEQADSTDPNIGLLVSNRWDSKFGEFGALANVSFAETNYRDQSVTPGALFPFTTDDPHANMNPFQIIRSRYYEGSQEDYSVDPEYWRQQWWQPGTEAGLPFNEGAEMTVGPDTKPYILSRDAIFASDFTGERERPAANISLQFAPNDSSEYLFEAFYNGYRNESFNNLHFSFVDWWGDLPENAADTFTYYPGTNVVKERSVINNVYGFNSGDLTKSKTDSFVYALGGNWDINENLKLASEVVYQTSEFEDEFIAMRVDRVAPSISVDFNDDDGLPAFAYGDNPDTEINESDITQPELWNLAQMYDQGNKDEGDAVTFTFDGEYVADWGFVQGVDFGLRYDNRSASEAYRGVEAHITGAGNFCDYPTPEERDACVALEEFDPALQHVNSDFFDGEADIPSAWVVPDGHHVYENRTLWRERYGFDLNPTPTKNFDIEEATTDLYVQADIMWGDLDGQIGLRYSNVSTDMTFYSAEDTTDDSSSYSELLPSISLRYLINPDLQARFAYTQTFRQPDFAQLNRNVTYASDVTNIGYGTATGGNPNLEPVTSTNMDLSLEWYFGEASSVFGTLFSRDIEGFVFESTVQIEYLEPGADEPYPYILTSPANSSDGKLTGLELGVVAFPESWAGFGVQASYTKMFESEQQLPNYNADGEVISYFERSIFGVSDDSYSVVLAYDNYDMEARLSYVWRDDFLNNYDQPLFANPRGVYRRPETSIDFQFLYDITDQVAVTFDATNLAGEIYQSYYQYPTTHNFGNSLYSRTFALGVRYSL